MMRTDPVRVKRIVVSLIKYSINLSAPGGNIKVSLQLNDLDKFKYIVKVQD